MGHFGTEVLYSKTAIQRKLPEEPVKWSVQNLSTGGLGPARPMYSSADNRRFKEKDFEEKKIQKMFQIF